ncbi:MAG: hypothetical protein MJ072_05265, partial [Clostridia bacterium]|nr:hypothetical protein [Clostridia bacterium]
MNTRLGNEKLEYTDEKIKNALTDLNKIHTHTLAKKLLHDSGSVDADGKPVKGKCEELFDELEKKFGPIPEDKKFMGRFFAHCLNVNTEPIDNKSLRNEKLFLSYQRGEDDIRKFFDEQIDKLLSVSLENIQKALQSPESAVDFYQKHFVECELASDIQDIVKNADGGVFKDDFKKYVENFKPVFDAMTVIKDQVALVADPLYFADVYDQPAFKNGEVSKVASGLPQFRDTRADVLKIAKNFSDRKANFEKFVTLEKKFKEANPKLNFLKNAKVMGDGNEVSIDKADVENPGFALREEKEVKQIARSTEKKGPSVWNEGTPYFGLDATKFYTISLKTLLTENGINGKK